MVTVEKIIEELKIGGYLDAAEFIEQQYTALNRTAEFRYLKAFVTGGDFVEEVYRTQLRALWTAYCLHYDLCVDMMEYHNDLLGLWTVMHRKDKEKGWSSYSWFVDFMRELLV